MTTCSGRQQEHLFFTIVIVEYLQVFGSVLMLGASVKSQMLDASVIEEYLHDIHQLSELRENQDFMASLDQLGEDPVEQFELATRSKDVVPLVFRLEIVQEQVRVVANLSELHHSVPQRLISDFARRGISGKHPVIGDAIIHSPLPGRQIDLDDHLDLVGQLLLDLALDSPEQERPENLMQSVDDEQLFLFTQLKRLLLVARHLRVGHRVDLAEGLVEPLLEFVARREDLRQQEVQERPQLTQVVLKGSACQEHSVR